MLYHPPVCIKQRESHTAELRTLTSIRTPAKTILRSITDTRIADTQSTMNKYFKFHLRHSMMDSSYFINR